MSDYLAGLIARVRGTPAQLQPLIAPIHGPGAQLSPDAESVDDSETLAPSTSSAQSPPVAAKAPSPDPAPTESAPVRTATLAGEIRLQPDMSRAETAPALSVVSAGEVRLRTEVSRSETASAPPAPAAGEAWRQPDPLPSSAQRPQASSLDPQPGRDHDAAVDAASAIVALPAVGDRASSDGGSRRAAADPRVALANRLVRSSEVSATATTRLVVRPHVIERRMTTSAPTGLEAPPQTAPTIRVTIGRVDVRAIMAPPGPPAPQTPKPEPRASSLERYLRARRGGDAP